MLTEIFKEKRIKTFKKKIKTFISIKNNKRKKKFNVLI